MAAERLTLSERLEAAHTTEGVECWCEPEVEYIDPSDPESPVIVIHRDRSEAH